MMKMRRGGSGDYGVDLVFKKLSDIIRMWQQR